LARKLRRRRKRGETRPDERFLHSHPLLDAIHDGILRFSDVRRLEGLDLANRGHGVACDRMRVCGLWPERTASSALAKRIASRAAPNDSFWALTFVSARPTQNLAIESVEFVESGRECLQDCILSP
jgi:hypothetical protein